jgi:hypothetical protein
MDRVSEPSTTPARPPHVTVAVWIAMVASVFVVLAAWDRITGLNSIDTRASLRPWLDDPFLKDNGVTLSELTLALKVASMVAAASATAVAVLGFETLRRSRGARLAMTVLAVPMFLGGLTTEGIFASAAAAAVATLWFGPARTWFEGGTAAAGAGPSARSRDSSAAGPARPTWPPRHDAPQGTPPPSPPVPPSSPHGSPAHVWAPPSLSAYDVPRLRRAPRPRALVSACLVTWAFCSLATLLVGASLVVLAVDSQPVLDRMHARDPQLAGSGLSDHQILVAGFVTGSVVLVWSLAAAVLAILAFRRRRRAWYALLGSSAAVTLLSLVGVVGSVVLVVPLLGSLAAMVLLLRPEVRAWFSG